MEKEGCSKGALCVLGNDFMLLDDFRECTKKYGENFELVDENAIKELKKNGNYEGMAAFRSNRGVMYAGCKILKREDNRYCILNLEFRYWIDPQIREKVFLTSPIPVFIITSEHVIVDANQAYLDLVSMKKEDVVGKLCYPIMHSSTRPPPGCPLQELMKIKVKNSNMNIMDTVFGNFLIIVKKIAPGIYGHYAMKEAAVLLEAQNRMLKMMERYNRILLSTVTINTILMKGKNKKKTLERIAEKIVEIDEFKGIKINIRTDNGKTEISVKKGDIQDLKVRFEEMTWKKSIVLKSGGEEYIILPMLYGGTLGYVEIHTGKVEMNEDERSVLETMANNIAMFVEAKSLDERREMAYSYMIEAMDNFAQLVDRIRNPLAVIMATAEVEIGDKEIRDKILENVDKVQEITKKIDELWNKAEEMREYFKGKE